MGGQDHDFAVSGVGTADHDGVLVVTVTGDLDLANVDAVREALGATLTKAAAGVVLNLAVKFIASGMLSMLVEINQRARQGGIGFAVAAAEPGARRPLLMTGLDQVFGLYDSVPDAVDALRQTTSVTGLPDPAP